MPSLLYRSATFVLCTLYMSFELVSPLTLTVALLLLSYVRTVCDELPASAPPPKDYYHASKSFAGLCVCS